MKRFVSQKILATLSPSVCGARLGGAPAPGSRRRNPNPHGDYPHMRRASVLPKSLDPLRASQETDLSLQSEHSHLRRSTISRTSRGVPGIARATRHVPAWSFRCGTDGNRLPGETVCTFPWAFYKTCDSEPSWPEHSPRCAR